MTTITPNTPRRFNRPELRENEAHENIVRFAALPAPKSTPRVRRYPSLSDDGQPWFGNSSPTGINSSANVPYVRVLALLAVLAILITLALAS